MTSPIAVDPTIQVSWDGSGAYDGPYDTVTLDVAAEPGLTVTGGRDGAQQLSPPRVTSGHFELINEGGKYSQENPTSPVYQRVEPNRPVRYSVTYGEAGVWDEPAIWDDGGLWDGLADITLGAQMIDEIGERNPWGDRRVSISTIGIETLLTRAPVTVPLMTNPRIDECITAILDAAAWPLSARSIEVSDTTLLYWWCDAKEPWSALLELLASEGPGTFGVDRDGNFIFQSRNHRTIASASTTSQATFYDTRVPGAYYYTDLTYSPQYRSLYNRATYTTRRREAGALQKVWEYGATVTLSAGQSTTLIARPTDPFTSAVSPASGTDYTVSAGSATVTLTYTSGLAAFIEIVAGGSGATIDGVTSTGIQLRASPLTVLAETTVTNRVDASASIARYSPIPGADIPLTLSIAGWPEIDGAAAQAVCDAWVLRQQFPRASVQFVIPNADLAHIGQILSRRVSDRLTLVQATTGLETDVWINALEVRVFGFDGARCELVVGAEKCDTLTGGVWDLSLWDDAEATWGV